MSPEMPASPSSDPRPRPAGSGDSSGGDRSRGRRRSGRGGRGRSGSVEGQGQAQGQTQGQTQGQAQGQPQGQAQGQTQGQAQGQGRGERRGEPRGERRGETRGDSRNRGGRRSGDGPAQAGESKYDRPRGERGGRGEGGGRPTGRGGGEAAKAQAQSQAQQQEAARVRRRESERESEPTPNLQDWSFDHMGYTAWMAHAQILPIRDSQRALRSYIVDIHAGEDAVNPRLWPEIAPFLKLETTGPGPEAGARTLVEMFRALAAEAGLRPAADYLAEHPPAEIPVSSPVQAALDTAIPLEPDTEQEDIDIMNEGRKGAPLRRPGE